MLHAHAPRGARLRLSALGSAVLAAGLLAGCSSTGSDGGGGDGGAASPTPGIGPVVAFGDLASSASGGEISVFRPIAGPGTTVLLPLTTGTAMAVAAVDYATGETVWQADLPDADPAGHLGCRTTADAATVHCLAQGDAGNRLVTLDATTGESLADVGVGAQRLSNVVDEGVVVLYQEGIGPNETALLDPRTGRNQWSVQLPDHDGGEVEQHAGALFFGYSTDDGTQRTTMVSAESGATIAELDGSTDVRADTVVRYGGTDDVVAAVGPDGTDLWQVDGFLADDCDTADAIYLAEDSDLLAVDPADGSVRWTAAGAQPEDLFVLDGAAVVPDGDYNLSFYAADTGEALATVPPLEELEADFPCGLPELLWLDADGITAFSAADGSPAWRIDHPQGWAADDADFLVTDRGVVVLSASGLYALLSD